MTAFILPHVDWSYRAATLGGVALWSVMTIGFTILASTPLSYANSPDIARYLPRSTRPLHIIAATAFGGARPASSSRSSAPCSPPPSAIRRWPPASKRPCSTCCRPGSVRSSSWGHREHRRLERHDHLHVQHGAAGGRRTIRRIPSAIVVGVIGTALTLYLVMSTNLLDAVNLMLQFLAIVSAPAMAIFTTTSSCAATLRRRRALRSASRWAILVHGRRTSPASARGHRRAQHRLCLLMDIWSSPISRRWVHRPLGAGRHDRGGGCLPRSSKTSSGGARSDERRDAAAAGCRNGSIRRTP